jgi:hypothetical protein
MLLINEEDHSISLQDRHIMRPNRFVRERNKRKVHFMSKEGCISTATAPTALKITTKKPTKKPTIKPIPRENQPKSQLSL